MSNVRLAELFKSVESGECNDKLMYEELEQGIKSRTYTILQVVECLGVLLTHKDTHLRKKGTEILSKCLSMLDKYYLSEEELEFLIAFYSDRIKDHHSVIPEVLIGLFHLCDMKHLSGSSYVKLFPVVFLHFHCQSQLIHDRKLFYDILYRCMQHNSEGLKPMGPDFIYGVIQSMDGERDPRNLMFLFTTFVPFFLNTFDLGHLAEEMFDIMACYFPVDFSPKENDPNAITREDLSSALMPNLTSKPEFAEFCIPLALEKLESDLKLAKLDSLVLLTNACYKFSIASISNHYAKIWNVIKSDLNTGDAEVKSKIIEFLHAILTVLPEEEALALFQNVYNYVKYSFTTNMDKLLFISNVKMMVNISKDSKVCTKEMATHLIPVLYAEINKTYNDELILILNEICQICIVNFNISLLEQTEISVDWDELLKLYFKLSSTSKPCLNGLGIFNSCFNVEQRKLTYKILYEMILSNDFSIEFENCLCTFGRNFKDELNDLVIRPIQKLVLEKAKSKTPDHDIDVRSRILNDLKQGNSNIYTKVESEEDTDFMKPLAYRKDDNGQEVPIFVAICPPAREIPLEEIYIKCIFCPLMSLTSYLKELSKDVMRYCLLENSNQDENFLNFSNENCKTRISYLRCIIEKYETSRNILNYLETEFNIVEKIIDIYLKNVSSSDIFCDRMFIEDCIAVVNIIQSSGPSNNTIMNLIKKYLTKDFIHVINDEKKGVRFIILLPLLNNVEFKLLENDQMISEHIKQLSDALASIAIHTKDEFTNLYASILLSLLYNSIDNLESNNFRIDVSSIENTVKSNEYTSNVFILHAYMTKALLMKGHKNIDYWLSVLIESLNDSKAGKKSIECLKIIIKQENIKKDYFQYRNVKYLYRQRLFAFTMEKIKKNLSLINENPNSEEINKESNLVKKKTMKVNNILAILVQLEHLSKQIIQSNMKTLLPIMIDALSLICNKDITEPMEIPGLGSDQDTEPINEIINSDTTNILHDYYDTANVNDALISLLNLFMELFKTKSSQLLEDHMNSFVIKFLYLAQHHTCLTHRILALQCLYHLSFFNIMRVVPYKQTVLQGLKSCLDDKKRLVRKQAVITIDRWYIVDNTRPGDEDE